MAAARPVAGRNDACGRGRHRFAVDRRTRNDDRRALGDLRRHDDLHRCHTGAGGDHLAGRSPHPLQRLLRAPGRERVSGATLPLRGDRARLPRGGGTGRHRRSVPRPERPRSHARHSPCRRRQRCAPRAGHHQNRAGRQRQHGARHHDPGRRCAGAGGGWHDRVQDLSQLRRHRLRSGSPGRHGRTGAVHVVRLDTGGGRVPGARRDHRDPDLEDAPERGGSLCLGR